MGEDGHYAGVGFFELISLLFALNGIYTVGSTCFLTRVSRIDLQKNYRYGIHRADAGLGR
jgi:hypothetical protein